MVLPKNWQHNSLLNLSYIPIRWAIAPMFLNANAKTLVVVAINVSTHIMQRLEIGHLVPLMILFIILLMKIFYIEVSHAWTIIIMKLYSRSSART